MIEAEIERLSLRVCATTANPHVQLEAQPAQSSLSIVSGCVAASGRT